METETTEKRMTLRLPVPLWRALHIEAGKRAISVHRLILDWLQEKVEEGGRQH